MKNLKIGIVEDDMLIAASIELTLSQIGYLPLKPVRNYADALKMTEGFQPDLLIIDITLDGKQDGIDLAAEVNEKFRIPFIFLTAYSDKATVARAKKVNPYAYLVKPFTESDLFTSIEIAFNNYNLTNKPDPTPPGVNSLKDVIFVKDGRLFQKIPYDDILFIQSDNVYLTIYTREKHYVVRTKLDDFIKESKNTNFFRVHRSYAVNLRHLSSINELSVKVGDREVPLQRNYRQALLESIRHIS